MSDWALAVVRSGTEWAASAELTRLGHPHLWFKRRVQAVVRGQVVERLRPAFPRYFWLPLSGAWQALRECTRMVYLVPPGEAVARVPAEEIERLRASCSGGDVFPLSIMGGVESRFRSGDRVRLGGMSAWSGQVGSYQYAIGDGMAIVLVEGMGRWITVPMDERDLEDGSRLPGKRRRRKRYRRRHNQLRSL